MLHIIHVCTKRLLKFIVLSKVYHLKISALARLMTIVGEPENRPNGKTLVIVYGKVSKPKISCMCLSCATTVYLSGTNYRNCIAFGRNGPYLARVDHMFGREIDYH